ncbi:hypothetical protein BJ742DRAFT_869902 [Cladochytrium replicatum]|nr:hypothetical protein BJ742DRAFT_869902 [Cladochytrium replicatum]
MALPTSRELRGSAQHPEMTVPITTTTPIELHSGSQNLENYHLVYHPPTMVTPLLSPPHNPSSSNYQLSASGNSMFAHASQPSAFIEPPHGVVILKSDALQGPNTLFPYLETANVFGSPGIPKDPTTTAAEKKARPSCYSRWRRNRLWIRAVGIAVSLAATIALVVVQTTRPAPLAPATPTAATTNAAGTGTTTRTPTTASATPTVTSIFQEVINGTFYIKPMVTLSGRTYNLSSLRDAPRVNFTYLTMDLSITLGRTFNITERRWLDNKNSCKVDQTLLCNWGFVHRMDGYVVGNASASSLSEATSQNGTTGLRMDFGEYGSSNNNPVNYCLRGLTLYLWCSESRTPVLVDRDRPIYGEGASSVCRSHFSVHFNHSSACPM